MGAVLPVLAVNVMPEVAIVRYVSLELVFLEYLMTVAVVEQPAVSAGPVVPSVERVPCKLSYTFHLTKAIKVILELDLTNIKGRAFLPPFFLKTSKYFEDDLKSRIYKIKLMAAPADIPRGKLLYSYHKNILITGEEGSFTVFINENRAELKRRYLEIGVSICFSMIMVEENLINLHSASIIMERRAFLFVGISGSGKTTLAKYATERGYDVLNDEINCIQILEDLSTCRVMSGPNWGREYFSSDFINPRLQNRNYPLAAVYFLDGKPGDETKISGIKIPEAAARMLKSFLGARFTCQLSSQFKLRVLNQLVDLVRGIPKNKLGICLNDNFLRKIF
jgi:hypothetical protein